jgi:hypothetical protein
MYATGLLSGYNASHGTKDGDWKGGLLPCLLPKLALTTPKLERYSCFWHWPNSSCRM